MEEFLEFTKGIIETEDFKIDIKFVEEFMFTLDSADKFPISIEKLVEWKVDPQKSHATKRLEQSFKEGNDFYRTLDKSSGGRSEIIMISIDCFKKACTQAQNNQGDTIRDYFLTLENLYKRYLKHFYELYKKNKDVLQEKEKEIEQTKDELQQNKDVLQQTNMKMETIKKLVGRRKGLNINENTGIYIAYYEEIENLYKIGQTFRIKGRMRSDTAIPYDYKLLEFIYTPHNELVERVVHYLFAKNRYRQYKEWFHFKDVTPILSIVKQVAKQLDDNANLCYEYLLADIPLNNELEDIMIRRNKPKADEKEEQAKLKDKCEFIIPNHDNGRRCLKNKQFNDKYCHLHTNHANMALITKTEKTCPRCKTAQPSTNFSTNPSRSDGLDVYCRVCTRTVGRENHRAKVRYDREVKQCDMCEGSIPLKEFANFKSNISDTCMNCITANYQWDKYSKIAIKCIECLEIYDLESYHTNPDNVNGYNTMCKSCIKDEVTDYINHHGQKKTCISCKGVFHLTSYFKTKPSQDGRMAMCKACRKDRYNC